MDDFEYNLEATNSPDLKKSINKKKILQMIDDIEDGGDFSIDENDKKFILSAIDSERLTADKVEILLEEILYNSESSASIRDICQNLGFLTSDDFDFILNKTNSTSSKISLGGSVDILRETVDKNVLKRVPYEIIKEKCFLPFRINNESLYVAVDYFEESEIMPVLTVFFTDCSKFVIVKSDQSSIVEKIDLIFNDKDELDDVIDKITKVSISNYDEDVKKHKINTGIGIPIEFIIELIDAIFVDSVKKNASDIHIEPEESFVRLRYRIDGDLKIIKNLHKKYWNNILIRVKVLAGMNIAETRRPQDGKISVKVFERIIDCRVSIHPTVHGENIVIRLLDKKSGLLSIDGLGFSRLNLNQISKAVLKPDGIVVVAGPTGSGKTTTLYSILNILNKPDVNIMTLEDPVEYNLPNIRQTNINEAVGLTFEAGMRALVRQDPDIILIGEIRDAETLHAAVKMSMTGHKVFSTVHAIDCISSIQRLSDIGGDVKSLVGNIVAVVSQRLVKILCPSCKVAVRPNRVMIDAFNLSDEEIKDSNVCSPKGCDNCDGTGYRGRSVIGEVLEFDDNIDDLLYRSATRSEFKKYLFGKNFLSMFDDAREKVLRGTIDFNEVVKSIKMKS